MPTIQQIKWSVIEALKETSDHWEDMEKDMTGFTTIQQIVDLLVNSYHLGVEGDETEEVREFITNAIADYPTN